MNKYSNVLKQFDDICMKMTINSLNGPIGNLSNASIDLDGYTTDKIEIEEVDVNDKYKTLDDIVDNLTEEIGLEILIGHGVTKIDDDGRTIYLSENNIEPMSERDAILLIVSGWTFNLTNNYPYDSFFLYHPRREVDTFDAPEIDDNSNMGRILVALSDITTQLDWFNRAGLLEE